MFKHVLVPLDGSQLAESVLPAVAWLAKRLGASITLIHIIEQGPSATIHGDRHLTQPDEAEAYLTEVAARLRDQDGIATPVECHVHTTDKGESDVARSIVDHTADLEPDLIVLAPHGSGGLRDIFFGNIAQQVIQMGRTPILVVSPGPVGQARAFAPRKILVTLDGSPAAEPALPVAEAMARAGDTSLHLLIVVPTLTTLPHEQVASGMLMPMATAAVLELAVQGAADYLRAVGDRLQAKGIPVLAEVHRGDPAPETVEVAERIDADLLVMTTRGEAGLNAFWSDSVSRKVAGHFDRPLLLVRAAPAEPGEA
jgi:nucleotide-binding universal stress UspA family protein